jgi:acyl carrier protein
MSTLSEVKQILADVLQLGDKIEKMDTSTPLLGNIPEFDSMAVISVITALEENYEFTVDDDEIDADIFQTIGSVVRFVEGKR